MHAASGGATNASGTTKASGPRSASLAGNASPEPTASSPGASSAGPFASIESPVSEVGGAPVPLSHAQSAHEAKKSPTRRAPRRDGTATACMRRPPGLEGEPRCPRKRRARVGRGALAPRHRRVAAQRARACALATRGCSQEISARGRSRGRGGARCRGRRRAVGSAGAGARRARGAGDRACRGTGRARDGSRCRRRRRRG